MAVGQRIATSEISKKSKDYDDMMNYWQLVSDLVGGLNTMKAKTVEYLPKMPAEGDANYSFRLQIAKFTNVYRDIVETLSSKPFEIPIVVDEANTQLTDWCEDVDGSGNDLTTFAMDMFFNGINAAIDWIFVDYVATDTTKVISVADAEKIGNRPYWTHCLATNAWDVRTRVVAGKEQLFYFKMFEPGMPNHIRIMEIRESGEAWFEVWREDKDKSEYVSINEGPITIGVVPMVPFTTGRRKGKSFRFYPMLRDAADLQLFLYRKENDLNFAEVMGCFPMISASGVTPDRNADETIKPLPVGPMAVLYAPQSGRDGTPGTYSLLEPAGSSFSQLSATIKTTVDQLRELGKMPLTAQTPGITVITSAIAGGKAKTAIGACALNAENALENALHLTCKWMATDQNPKVKINREFDDVDQSSETNKTMLTTMRKNGDLSQETYWEEMKEYGVLSDDFDAVQELERLSKEKPADEETDPTQQTIF